MPQRLLGKGGLDVRREQFGDLGLELADLGVELSGLQPLLQACSFLLFKMIWPIRALETPACSAISRYEKPTAAASATERTKAHSA
jgi:hypothetical protein